MLLYCMMFLELVLSISLDVSCSSDIWLPGKMVRSSYTTYDHSFCGWHVWPTERDIEWVWGHHLPLARVHFLSWSCKSKHYFWTSDSIVIIDWPFFAFSIKKAIADIEKAVIEALEKQYADVLAPLKDSMMPKKFGLKYVQKLAKRNSVYPYTVPDDVSSLITL